MRAGALLSAGVAVALAVSASLFGATVRADDWRIYQNDRYGTTIDYPGTFKPLPPPDNDDGRRFKSADGAHFAVYAVFNVMDFNVDTFRDDTVKHLDAGSVVTYQASGNNWFVISGTKGDDVFYERHRLTYRGEMAESFVISYPAKLKAIYDPIVARMAKSLRSGTGFQTPRGKP
jgi:hypothetical protein